jgi:single-stranded DNA-binding protein
VHVHKVVVIGRIGERGVKVTYSEQAIPTCSFVLEVDEVSQSGKIFTTCLPVEIVGRYAEDVAHNLEPGDEVLVDATLKYRRLIDNKTGENASKWVVSGWTRPCQRSSAPLGTAARSPADEPHRQASLRAGAAGSAHALSAEGHPCAHSLLSLCRRGLPGHAGDGAGGGRWRHEAHATASMLPSP